VPLPTNTDPRASEELSEALETILIEANEEPITLGMARDRLKEAFAEQDQEAGRGTDGGQSIYAELEALVEEYGEDAPARDFIAMKASDHLADLIAELLEQTEDEQDVTIGLVREAVKEAMIDPDAGQALVAELDALIERYGENALAEDVLPFE
jgi:hypothetical protein